MRIYDVSVPIHARMPVYPGDPQVEIEAWAAIAKGDVANLSCLRFGAHTGTHVDASAHFIEGGRKVAELPLDVLVGAARVIEIPEDVREIKTSHLTRANLSGATRVLFKTRNSSFWGNDAQRFREDFAYLSPDVASLLVENGVQLVGIDYLSIEEFHSATHDTHKILLSNEVVIIEALDLSAVPVGDYELICLPIKIAEGSGDGAPARTILRELRK
ncbi:MAG: cyclase family protein [Pyrinomonadaceae bacterium]|nr:cyclase family protein [Pyrinomonadaceae bacterium]